MQLQHFIKEKLEKNEFKAALANEELVFFTVCSQFSFFLIISVRFSAATFSQEICPI